MESIHNIVATWDAVSEVGLSIAPPITIRIESNRIESNVNPIHNHSIVTLTDALAVHHLFATIDPSLSVEAIGSILEASSNSATSSLESALSALGAVYGKSYPATESGRDALYTKLYELESTIASQTAGGLKINVLGTTDPASGTFTPFSPSQIESLARGDIAYRFALVQGNAFAVLGADYSQFNQNGELDIYNPATGRGQLTNMYLADRAEMLANLILANTYDTASSGTDVHYVDQAKNIFLNEPLLLSPSKKITFGSEQGDVLQGTDPTLGSDNVIDHLYGMGGDDYIEGGGGDDYIEGGDGHDMLMGGDDVDILTGGKGFDYLDGGSGNDRLEGGADFDTYIAGDGDTINDSDGLGRVKMGSGFLTGGTKADGDDYYTGKDGTLYQYEGSNLIVYKGGSTLTIENLSNRELGIYLDKAESTKNPPPDEPSSPEVPKPPIIIRGIAA